MVPSLSRRALLAVGMGGLISAAASAGAAPASGIPPDVGAGDLDVSFDLGGRAFARVYLNGQGPYRFLVDTGASRSLISLLIANALGVRAHRSVVVHGTTGDAVLPVGRLASLDIGAIHAREQEVLILADLPENHVDGILGTDLFAERCVKFDMRRQTVHILNSQRDRFPKAYAFEVRPDRLPEARGLMGDIPVRMILDTGAVCSVINDEASAELKRAYPSARGVHAATVVGLTGDRVSGEAVALPPIRFGPVRARGVTALAANVAAFRSWKLEDTPAMLVGLDVLSALGTMQIDYGTGAFMVTPRGPGSAFPADLI